MTHGRPPIVDVGIPTRGRATYLAEAIESVLGQTLADVRITVGENGSGSSSVAAAVAPYLSDPRVRHVVHGEDLGAAGNFSALVQIGEAPYVALLHDDDRWSPEFLERRVEFLETNPGCGLVFSGCYVIDGSGAVVDVWEATLAPGVHTPQTFLPAMYDRNLIPVPTVLVRRTAYEAVGPDFSDELLFDDHEMWLRLGSRFDVGCLPDLDASYRVHGDQISVEHGHGLGRHRLALQDAVEALLPADVSRDVPRRARSAAHMHAAADAMEGGDRASAVGHLGQALVRHPATVVSPAGLRRALLILLALVPGKAGARVWRARRDRGRRLAAAGGARRAAARLASVGFARDDSPLFSVVVPAFNAERTIASTLESILCQTCRSFEVIVVDDGSVDRTAEIAREFADPRISVASRENRGVSAARNVGIGLARGRLISFLDADDLWLPSYLAEMRVLLQAEPEPGGSKPGLAFTDAWVFDEPARRIRRQPMMSRHRPVRVLPEDPEEVLELLIGGNFVFTSATVPAEVLAAAGGFDESLAHSEDYDLWLRIVERGYGIVHTSTPLAVYRIRSHSLSSDRRGMVLGEQVALTGLLARGRLSARSAQLAERRRAQLDRQLERLDVGARDRPLLFARLRSRAWRLRREGPLYRKAPPELVEIFPQLVTEATMPPRLAAQRSA